jgi:hypothetical protein
MSKKIIIDGLKEKDLSYLNTIKKMILEFIEKQQDKLSYMNAMHFFINDNSDFGISIYQSKTKIFVKINYVEVKNEKN